MDTYHHTHSQHHYTSALGPVMRAKFLSKLIGTQARVFTFFSILITTQDLAPAIFEDIPILVGSLMKK